MGLKALVLATDLLWVTTAAAQAFTTGPRAFSDTLPPAFKSCAEQMISVFENESISLKYDYVENLNDGRGYTAGRAGFVTRDGDLLQVVQVYSGMRPNNVLSGFLPILKKVRGTSEPILRICQIRVARCTETNAALIIAERRKGGLGVGRQ